GVKKFNDVCREKIKEVSDEWGQLIPRFGRWSDMDNPYRTMDKTFMESEWWMFKQLHDKDLVYEDYRSIHICPRCETTLSQSEVAEGYKDIKDLSVTVKFRLREPEEAGLPKDTYLLAWTTTPWTLPGNVALAVGREIEYLHIMNMPDVKKGSDHEFKREHYLVSKEAFNKDAQPLIDGDENNDTFLFKGILVRKTSETIQGKELLGLRYDPPFDSYVNDEKIQNREQSWRVYLADFINTETGTGIAHEAPAFGAEDLELAQEVGLPVIQHLGMDGIIYDEVKELAGLHVKPIEDHQSTDVEVIKYLAGKGLLFSKEKYEHSYPHCWRCDTPLLNYATNSWFVAVEKMKERLLKYADEITWSPGHIKKGRWGNWLEGARDWSISRQRFWANTIPVWRCDECKNTDVFGSIAELKEKSGVEVDDLHKDVVDEVTYKCDCGGEMVRVPDVLDTWFNSGSVPFASYHYPFENKEKVDNRIPADFIAEGTDQTRAWFYYQHILVGGVFEKPAFKNVIVNGMVMAEDGKKMSKKLKNYPDPTLMLDTYGADAIRLYILSSQVVRAEDFNFIEKEAAQVASKVMGRLANVHSFYELYKDSVEHEGNSDSKNVLDRWIIARMHQMHAQVTTAMDSYELDKATRPLGEFVDDLSTWYIRRSRDRLKSDAEALSTLRWVLRKYAKVSAPFTPFIAEWLWSNVKRKDDEESVHLAKWCKGEDADEDLLLMMRQTRLAVEGILFARNMKKIKVRQPLSEVALNADFQLNNEMIEIVKDETNIKEISFYDDRDIITKMRSQKDWYVLHDIGTLQLAIKTVGLNPNITPELKKEGMARDVIRAIQNERKEKNLEIADLATVIVSGSNETLAATHEFKEEIQKQTNTTVENGKEQDEIEVDLTT
ncbi:isoleucine--tRNA ligase, partial [Candidatus Kaiserbacteria bacterium]